MQYSIIPPSSINTTISLPASKSICNRALVINALAKGTRMPDNLSDCDDTQVIVKALNEMPPTIDIKAAGTAMRFMTAYLAVTAGEHTITGTERMLHRPIQVLVNALRYLGADVSYLGEEGFPPLHIRGKQLEGGKVELPGNVSSQYISALLMIGPVLKNGIELTLTDTVISRPYIDLTIHLMHDFGAKVTWTDVRTIKAEPGGYTLRPFLIENDWSAASYWYEMMALCKDYSSEVRLTGLCDGSRQGDSGMRYLFSMLGVKTIFSEMQSGVPTTVTLKKLRVNLPRLDFDFINQPDMVQTFVVCCALKNIPFHFTGVGSLKIKETNRIEALKTEMRKLGYVIRDVDGKELLWDGERCEPSLAPIDTYDDHRMAMAFSPAAFLFPGLRINNPHVVSKSYPHFWQHLEQAGFVIQQTEE
ncbi:MAG: 3-phosphoshikimate 1-carboxyvinyltransferase [Prevotella sp.]|nr:3-phosphoshikimate 1-carboxyvinyltransferase [Prevotella sp.]